MAVLEDIKSLLDVQDDTRLNTIVKLTENRLKALLNVKEVPSELEYIVVEIAVRRFNKIGSEGFSSHSVEGESMTLKDNDFDSFQDDIETWVANQKEMTKGRVRFL